MRRVDRVGLSALNQGRLVEDFARRLAGNLGVPDFVYEPVTVRRGTAVREVSDGLLIVGDDGAIIQVKSRERVVGHSDDPGKAESWLRKKAAEAQRQVAGTRRTLNVGGTRVRSLRGYRRTVRSAATWPGVVILDHPSPVPIEFGGSTDTLYISLGDWHDLHRMVRSTAGVVTYVRRALESSLETRLGHESERYRALARADLEAPGSLTSFPTLTPARLDEDERRQVAFFDDLVERVADSDGATGWHPETYVDIVEQLDRVPVLGRQRIGAKMEQAFEAMVEARARRSFIASDPSGNRLAFLFDYDSGDRTGADGERFAAHIAAYGSLRQHHAQEAGAVPGSSTLAIGLLHNPERGRRYAFALMKQDPPELPPDLRRALELEFGVFTGGTIRTISAQ